MEMLQNSSKSGRPTGLSWGDGIWGDRWIMRRGRLFSGTDRKHWCPLANIQVAYGKKHSTAFLIDSQLGTCKVELHPEEYCRFMRESRFEGPICVNGTEVGEVYVSQETSRAVLHVDLGVERLSVWREFAGCPGSNFVVAIQHLGVVATIFSDGYWPGWKEVWQNGFGFRTEKIGQWTGPTTDTFPETWKTNMFSGILFAFALRQTGFGWIFDYPSSIGS